VGTVEVLVAGAGPVGLTLASELAKRGVAVRVVDAATGPAVTSRALATHARTLEVYEQIGVLEEILERGQRVSHFTLHGGGRQYIRFDTDYSRLPTRFPFTLMIDQAITEEVLRRALARHGVKVEWGVELTGAVPEDDRVSVRLRHHGGEDGPEEQAAAAWLAGCDGGHSAVRKLMGLPLLGDSTETWLIADAVVHADLPADSIHWLRAGSGTVMLVPFPEPGKWRLLDTADVTGAGDPALIAARFAGKITAATGKPARVEPPTWCSVFTIQQRMIPAMRAGRCFVAGDAAHVHSPASGQGMNTGIQDAHNLAWKLAMVVRGDAGQALLDSYSTERVPVGKVLLGSTKMATSLVALKNTMLGVVMPVGLGLLERLPLKHVIERKIMKGMSGLALRYDTSPLTHGAADSGRGPLPGARITVTDADTSRGPGWSALLAELREPRWILLASGPAAHWPERPWLSVLIVGHPAGAGHRVLPDADGALGTALGLRPGDWLLIRPDGYVSARGTLDETGDGSVLAGALAAAAGGLTPAAVSAPGA
jgi:NADPH-dependent dioxygenase